jgi:hypothetical protein
MRMAPLLRFLVQRSWTLRGASRSEPCTPFELLDHPRELLERVAVLRGPTAAHRKCLRHLAYVEIVLGVEPQSVWHRKAAGRRGIGRAPAREQPACRIKDGET